ncbi:MAG: hypothetical protein ACOCV4_02610, partial [Myxococcota bacterium]
GVVEEGEECDPPDGETCDENCQIIEAPMCEEEFIEVGGVTEECAGCLCENCEPEATDCFLATDVADEGPAAGEPRSDLCMDVVTCVQEAGCDPEDQACLFSNCQAEIEAAAETTDLTLILDRAEDTDFAVGRANAFGACASGFCSAECL